MSDLLITLAVMLALVVPALWIGRRLWGTPGESDDAVWASALAPEVERHGAVVLLPVEHVGASEAAPAVGAIGTLAPLPSADLQTLAEQVAGDVDEWASFTQALVDYENAMLTVRRWPNEIGAKSVESTQQRIDRWLSEGGDGVRAARAETRQAVSETWDAPSKELPILDRYVADRMAESLLAS